MTELEILIDKIKTTDYEHIKNGQDLKELDFMDLINACQELENKLDELERNQIF